MDLTNLKLDQYIFLAVTEMLSALKISLKIRSDGQFKFLSQMKGRVLAIKILIGAGIAGAEQRAENVKGIAGLALLRKDTQRQVYTRTDTIDTRKAVQSPNPDLNLSRNPTISNLLP